MDNAEVPGLTTSPIPARMVEYHDQRAHCHLCNHFCHIAEGKSGICKVRRMSGGQLQALSYGMVSAEAVDPIEKKPLFHFLPGTYSYSLGSIGCNFSCAHCQNWHISQASFEDYHLRYLPPEIAVERAVQQGCKSISWTYNEPTMSFEYSLDMGRLAKNQGLGTVYVTNGYMTGEALRDLAPVLDAWRVDIKAMNDNFYRSVCHAHLKPVLDTTVVAKELGLHIETVTLIIPGLNDDESEIRLLVKWVYDNLGPDTPMHFTRFHPDYKMTDRGATPIKTLEKAYNIAREEGIRYPYLGNVSGHPYEHTYCPECRAIVIDRRGFTANPVLLDGEKCSQCGNEIAIIRRI